MADWDADDFDPDADGKLSAPKLTDKWDGEDEDDDIKDAWDAESEEEKDDDSQKDENKVVKVKKKKNLAQKIAEKEEAAAKARLEKLAREEEEKQLNTPEGKLAEKLRLQKMQEENDLQLAQEMMGVSGGGGGVIDNSNPSSKEEFEDLSKAITDKLSNFESSEHYQDFIENLVKNLCMSLTAKSKKGKTGPKLKMDSALGHYDGFDDMDDFM